jgi:hypothetical protein
MAEQFYLKKGDTGRAMRVQLGARVNGVWTPQNLTGATVKFNMRPKAGGARKVDNQDAVINDAPTGDVEYRWAAADVDTVGSFLGEFVVTAGGKESTFPAGPAPYSYIEIEVQGEQ